METGQWKNGSKPQKEKRRGVDCCSFIGNPHQNDRGFLSLKDMGDIRFSAIQNVLTGLTNISEEAWFYNIDFKTKNLIIELNTKDQLGRHGIDSTDNSLGEYAPFTVEFRLSEGLQVGHIDFKVTGEYWASWEVEVTANELIINVDLNRFNELVNELRFSEDHVGLTKTNMAKVQALIRENYISYVRQRLLQ